MHDFDVMIAGAGATGLAAALALVQTGCRVKIIGRLDASPPTRTVALWTASVRLLENLGVWERARAQAQPLVSMRIVDSTGSLFALPPVEFHARDIGLEGFGYNIANVDLVEALLAAVKVDPRITLHEALVHAITPSAGAVALETDDQTKYRSRLLIGAEGSQSPSRRAAGITTRQWAYPQSAVTALLHHRLPHNNISTEFHTRAGPCTLVPLAGRTGAPHRSSLVWLMSPPDAERRRSLSADDFADEVETTTQSLLGRFTLEGQTSAFPMRGMVAERFGQQRIMLVGEAAHAFPPIGAQGLNLGLRDVGVMADVVGTALATSGDCGADDVTTRYHQARASDVALRTSGVDILNHSLLAPYLPVDFLRGAGLMALGSLGPLRRAVMRMGVAPHNLPPLMRPQPSPVARG